jgi:hypothetical protein
MRGLVLLPCLLACKAESLGVDVPKGGVEALSQEDLQRDVFALTQGALDRRAGQPGQVAAMGTALDRLRQMHTLPGFGEEETRTLPDGSRLVCTQRDGRSGKAVVVAAEDAGTGASGAAAIAAVISLAKAFDIPAPPVDTLVFCVWPGQAGREAYAAQPAVPLNDTRLLIVLGPLDGSALVEDSVPVGTAAAVRLQSEPRDWHGTVQDGAERIDYRKLQQVVATLYVRTTTP